MPTPIAERPLGELLEQLGAKTPTPGGGAVASTVGALAAALAQMVLAYSVGKRSLAEHHGALERAASRLTATRDLMLGLAAEDEAAYGLLNELSRLPEGDPRRAGIPAAALTAAQVPLSCMAAAVSTLRLLDTLPAITNRHLRSDLAIAALLAEAAARAAGWNVEVNLPGLEDPADRARLRDESDALHAAARGLAQSVELACREA